MQNLDVFENHNPNHIRLSLVPETSNDNVEELCLPQTPKLTSVDSLCRQTEVHNVKNEDSEPENGFLNRVVFDRAEILRKHYNIEKTDKELIEETLHYFSKKLVNENKPLNQPEFKNPSIFKPKLKSVNKQAKTNEQIERHSTHVNQTNIRNEFSVNDLINSIDKKKRDISIKRNENDIQVDENKKMLVSFKDVPKVNSSTKRFLVEDREPDSNKSNTQEKNMRESNKMEFSIDNQLLNRFNDSEFILDRNSFIADARIAPFKPNVDTYNNQVKNYFSITFDDLEYKEYQKSNEINAKNNISVSNYNTQNDKETESIAANNSIGKKNRINLDRIRFKEIKPRLLKTDADCYVADDDSHNGDIRPLSDISSCESFHKDLNENCYCGKLKKMADKLGVPYDTNFVDQIHDALFKNIMPRTLDNIDKRPLSKKLKIFNRKLIDNIENVSKEKRGLLNNKENSIFLNDRVTNHPLDGQIKARIDKLKAFKRYFMKTDHVGPEMINRKRKQSNELNTFR